MTVAMVLGGMMEQEFEPSVSQWPQVDPCLDAEGSQSLRLGHPGGNATRPKRRGVGPLHRARLFKGTRSPSVLNRMESVGGRTPSRRKRKRIPVAAYIPTERAIELMADIAFESVLQHELDKERDVVLDESQGEGLPM